MESFFTPTVQAVLAGLGSWLSIALGASFIYARKEFSRKLLQLMLGVAGGMMLGATFFALLMPSMELSKEYAFLDSTWAFIPPIMGLFLGALFLRAFDAVLPHTHEQSNVTEGVKTSWNRSILLFAAMALHHIPEGLAIGVSYGAMQSGDASSAALSMADVLLLTTSMMVQGIPEGTVVSMALLREGMKKHTAFTLGMLSGCTTPLGTLLGLWGTTMAADFLPVALAFAAGAMLYIIVEDIIPESQASAAHEASGPKTSGQEASLPLSEPQNLDPQNTLQDCEPKSHGNAATLAVIGGLCIVIIFQTIFS